MAEKMIEKHVFNLEDDDRGILQVGPEDQLIMVRIEVSGERLPHPGPFEENMEDAVRDFKKQFPGRDYKVIEAHWTNGDWAIGIIPHDHYNFVMTKKQWQMVEMKRALS